MTRAVTEPQINLQAIADQLGATHIGKITKEYIELNKEILEEEKQKAKEETYDTT